MPRGTIVFDILRISVHQLLSQRRRYLGVMVAIALGAAGFIVIATMGKDVKRNLNRDLNLLGGVNLIRVYFDPYDPARRNSKIQGFEQPTIDAIRALPGVDTVSVIATRTRATLVYKKEQVAIPTIVAVDGSFWSANSYTPVKGSFFNEEEIRQRSRVCVLGERVARTLLGDRDGVGETVKIDNEVYRITGLLGGVAVGDLTDVAFVPLTTAESFLRDLSKRSKLYVRCLSWDDVGKVAAAIPALVQARQPSDSLRVEVRWDELKRVRGIAWWVELFVYFSTGATLILGGFGIWNGMMASVKARKTEIGLKKAMGAEDRDILAQFMIEAVCLSFTSALLGGVLGRAAMEVGSYLLHSRPQEHLFYICAAMALLFSLVLGAAAGFYPSLRASRMEIVNAIRCD